MGKDFHVVKFGEAYFKEMAVDGVATVLTVVDDLTFARKYKDLDRESIQRLLNFGGSVVEVSIREYDRTFSIEREWEEEDDAEEADGSEKDS